MRYMTANTKITGGEAVRLKKVGFKTVAFCERDNFCKDAE